jgi:hypothetical protein
MGVFKIIFGRILGFLGFLILLGIANLLKFLIHDSLYVGIIDFLNVNLFLLLIMLVVGMVNDLFWLFKYNIFAPLVSAVLSVFIVTFFYRITIFITAYKGITFEMPLNIFYYIVPAVVLVGGYILIISRFIPQKIYLKEENKSKISEEDESEEKPEKTKKKPAKTEKKKKTETISWSDVGEEFKAFFHNIASVLNEGFKKKKRKKKKS